MWVRIPSRVPAFSDSVGNPVLFYVMKSRRINPVNTELLAKLSKFDLELIKNLQLLANKVWWICMVRPSEWHPGYIMVQGDGCCMLKFKVNEDQSTVTIINLTTYGALATLGVADEENPLVVPISEIYRAMIKLSEEESAAAKFPKRRGRTA